MPKKEAAGEKKNIASFSKFENIANIVLKSINKKDMGRAVEYMRARSGLKDATPTEMIEKMIRMKNIKSADEFQQRYEMGAFTFMSLDDQNKELNKLMEMARNNNDF